MKERSILFNTEMVRAILDERKVQTRRVIKPQPTKILKRNPASASLEFCKWPAVQGSFDPDSGYLDRPLLCPYGNKNDRLWVRETYQGPLVSEDEQSDYYANSDKYRSPKYCEYKADGGATPEFMTGDDDLVCRWRPSIHMPRWASRIILEITNIRVEKLQDISEEDAEAEGISWLSDSFEHDRTAELLTPSAIYSFLWESINGAGSWDANPWVWVIDFKRVIV
ncbi:MAG: hypothetical protein ACXWT0_00160 [Methylobacter sp.]